MININRPIITVCILITALLSQSNAFAASDETDIDISVTHTEYVNFTGTAPGASKFYDNDDLVNFIFPIAVNLGTMGLESNVAGDCDMNFSTLNSFRLLHTLNNQNLSDNSILYEGQTFSQASNQVLTIPCNTTPTDLNFILTGGISLVGIDFLIPSGVYRDVVTVTVTTQ